MKFDYSENIQQNKTVTFSGKILFGLTGGIAVGLTVVCAAFVAPAFRRFCLPYVPATPQQISNVLKCLPSSMRTTKERLLDIGSGDGRIVITVARHGMQADGVELNRWLVLYSRWMAFYHNVTYKTNFIRKDLWKFDLQPYNYIVIFGVDSMVSLIRLYTVRIDE